MEQERLAWWNSLRPAPWNKKDGDIPRGKPAVDPVGRRRGDLEYIFTWGNEYYFEYFSD